MKLKETVNYPSTADKVYDLITDRDFREASTLSAGGTDVTVSVERDGAGAVVTIVRKQPADVPDFIKKFTGDAVTIKQVEAWGEPDSAGNRKAVVKMSVPGQPVGMQGHASLTGSDHGSDLTVSGDVKVSVPFIGKKIEPVIARAVAASVRHDGREGKKRL